MQKESKVKQYLMLFFIVEMILLLFFVIDIIVQESMQAKADTKVDIKADTGYALVSDDNVCIFTDSETGVQYVVYRERKGNAGIGGITPRLDAEGNIMIDSSFAE